MPASRSRSTGNNTSADVAGTAPRLAMFRGTEAELEPDDIARQVDKRYHSVERSVRQRIPLGVLTPSGLDFTCVSRPAQCPVVSLQVK